jgi:hypothetical protein
LGGGAGQSWPDIVGSWVVAPSIVRPTGYRRLTLRYECCARLFTAFLTLAATLTCFKKLTL